MTGVDVCVQLHTNARFLIVHSFVVSCVWYMVCVWLCLCLCLCLYLWFRLCLCLCLCFVCVLSCEGVANLSHVTFETTSNGKFPRTQTTIHTTVGNYKISKHTHTTNAYIHTCMSPVQECTHKCTHKYPTSKCTHTPANC